MKRILLMLLIATLAIASFGQKIESNYTYLVDDGDSTLQNYVLEHIVLGDSSVYIKSTKYEYSLDTVQIYSKSVAVSVQSSDTLHTGDLAGDVINDIFTNANIQRLKALLRKGIKNKRKR